MTTREPRTESTETEERPYRFSNWDLRQLIIPLVGEQFLAMALGVVDTVMVASVGEAAISGISLVNIIATLIIQLLGALCTGGAVVVAQYLGRQDPDNSCKAAEQLLLLAVGLMTAFTVLSLLFREPILRMAFGAIESDVMESAQVYWLITAFSFPFLAAYNASVAVFRSIGNSKAALHTSLIMNIIHLAFNFLFIYGWGWGVAGAAVSTLISRAVAAVIMLVLLRSRQQVVHVDHYLAIRPDARILKSIFRIGVPNGIENGLFNFGKLLVQGVIAGLGTAALAANAVMNSISSFLLVPGMSIAYAMITVVGQCVGGGDFDQARYYVKKLMKIAFVSMAAINLPLLFLGGPILDMFNLGEEARRIALLLLPTIAVAHSVIWPVSFTLPNALRAAGDVRYTMVIAFLSMWLARVGLSYVFVVGMGLGVAGVWYSMFVDWVARSVFFALRYRSGKWKTMRVLE